MSDLRRSLSLTHLDEDERVLLWLDTLIPGSIVSDSDKDLWVKVNSGGWYLTVSSRGRAVDDVFTEPLNVYLDRPGDQPYKMSNGEWSDGPVRYLPVKYAGVHKALR